MELPLSVPTAISILVGNYKAKDYWAANQAIDYLRFMAGLNSKHIYSMVTKHIEVSQRDWEEFMLEVDNVS